MSETENIIPTAIKESDLRGDSSLPSGSDLEGSALPTDTTVGRSDPIVVHKKFPLFSVILLIILSVVSVISVYLFLQIRELSISQPAPSPSPSPIASADPTESWQMYQNTKYFYQFKHPNFLTIRPFAGTQESPSEATMYKLDPEAGETYALISITPNTSIPTVGLMIGESINGYSTYYKNHPDGVPSDSTPISIVEILSNNKSIQFIFRNTAELDEQAKQILSTFKFTSSSTSYTCPISGYADCMPSPDGPKPSCTKEAMDWYKANCPDFKGGAL